jgi:hypothetical protein
MRPRFGTQGTVFLTHRNQQAVAPLRNSLLLHDKSGREANCPASIFRDGPSVSSAGRFGCSGWWWSYEPLLIPGLLQTEAYARALIGGSSPPLDDETVAERVAARLRRAEALRRKVGVMYGFVIYEAALRTNVGGINVMREQLWHLLDVGVLRNVSIQLLPFGRCSGVALNGSIVLLETPEHEHCGYIEAPEASIQHSSPAKVLSLKPMR